MKSNVAVTLIAYDKGFLIDDTRGGFLPLKRLRIQLNVN